MFIPLPCVKKPDNLAGGIGLQQEAKLIIVLPKPSISTFWLLSNVLAFTGILAILSCNCLISGFFS